MSEKHLVIVESPTKAKTITKFLGKNYIVKASNGHVRDLPNNASEIPEKLKKEAWAKLGVNVNDNFEPLYIVPPRKKEQVKSLKESLKLATSLYLATDEDREGESISWHLVETLKPTIPTKRLVFHEITKDAIKKALESPREIDYNLVKAQETRRIVDRLFGYELSPVLWKKIAPGLSAGRVQSVAVRLLVEREQARIKFKSAKYYLLRGIFGKIKSEKLPNEFEAELHSLNSKRVAQSKDFDPDTGELKSSEILKPTSEALEKIIKDLPEAKISITEIEEKPYKSSPPAPFTTSTLQQEGNIKLRFSARRTMQVAQQLYENGFITYMRTDSTTLSTQAINAARELILDNYGKDYLPNSPRIYQTKVKNAQEAHEAIRPAGENFPQLEDVKSQLGDEAFRLYELIWKRTVACQMNDSRGKSTSVTVQLKTSSDEAIFKASGKTIEFPGFLRAYVEGSHDPDAEIADKEKILPELAKGEALLAKDLKLQEKETQPPFRYTEGSLIKELERRGIGRPSTWATVVETVLNRAYAFKKGTSLVPTFTAMAVLSLLQKHFPQLLDYEFTAKLEDDLDDISRGEFINIDYLKNFYFGDKLPGLKELVKNGESDIDPREVCRIDIPLTSLDPNIPQNTSSETLEIRVGRYGPFVSNGTTKASIPENLAPDELTYEKVQELLNSSSKSGESLGQHPITGEPIFVKVGRFGPYVQLGEVQESKTEETPSTVEESPEETEEGSNKGTKKSSTAKKTKTKKPAKAKVTKPKMASLLAGMTPETVTLEEAVKLLSLPRNLGKHPETQEDIIATNGRFGPYIKSGSETRSLSANGSPVTDISLEEALELLKQEKKSIRASRAPASLKDFGADAQTGLTIKVLSGRYGAYVTDGEVNASVPKGVEIANLTIEDAKTLLQARRDSGATAKPKKSRKK